MSEDVARAVGAPSGVHLVIKGKHIPVRPLNLKELTEVQRICIKSYRDNWLESWHDSMKYLPNPEETMLQKIDESAKWTIENLPKKRVYTSASLLDSEILAFRESLESSLGIDCSKSPVNALRRILDTALDQELITEEQFQKVSGKPPKKMLSGYVNWWITATMEGMVTLIWMCARDHGITKDDIIELMSSNQEKMIELSREIESVTAPSVGNG